METNGFYFLQMKQKNIHNFIKGIVLMSPKESSRTINSFRNNGCTKVLVIQAKFLV